MTVFPLQLKMLFLISLAEKYNPSIGLAVITRNSILLPERWFMGYSDEENSDLAIIEEVYILQTGFDKDSITTYVDIPMQTEYNSSGRPLLVYGPVGIYVALTPAPQYRVEFEQITALLDKDPASVQLFNLRDYYYGEGGATYQIADYNEGDFLTKFEFDRVSVIFKMQEFSYLLLNKNGTTADKMSETFPVMTCELMRKTFEPVRDFILVFDDDQELNRYAPYVHPTNGTWYFKPRTPLNESLEKQINSGDLILTKCNLIECSTRSKSQSVNFDQCAAEIPPLTGIVIDYKLPDESVDQTIIIVFTLLCILLAVLLAIFMFLGISTEKAKSRRVTNKQKNKAVNQQGGGAKGQEEKGKQTK